jgi:hypothetical protein
MEKSATVTAAPFEYDDPALWRLVPGVVREMAEYIGRRAAVALCLALGGENFSIPVHENANANGAKNFQRLVEAIGRDATRQLCAAYGGVRLSVPKMSAVHQAVRCRSIERFVASKVAAGASQRAAINEAARAFNMTSRAVEKSLERVV